jgi:hypothetical protein
MTEKRGVPDRKSSKKPPLGKFSHQRSPNLNPQPSSQPSNVATPSPSPKDPVRLRSRAKKLLFDWRFVTTLGLITTLGLTTVSALFLLKIPALPNCPSIFWPLASASLRLQCAQLAASKRTAKDLIEAIELVGTITKDHPIYEEASRWIEEWSKELLDAAQEEFNNGDLKAAIAAARKIPAHAAAAKQVDSRIKQWESIWSEAEAIVKKVDAFLAKRNWRDAFNEATKLLSLENPYWQNKRYTELGERIATAKEEITKIGQADRALEDGNADDLLKALQEIETIPDNSALYKDVQDLKPRIGKRLITLAEAAADRGSFDEALRIANKIPESLKTQQDTDDFILLVSAQSKASKGNSLEIEEAISQAARIPEGRPLYARAQTLITRWQTEIRDIAQLDRARDLARAGNPEGIQAAIAEAAAIGVTNPKYREARDFIEKESSKLQIKPPKAEIPSPTLPETSPSPTIPDSPNIAQAQPILEQANRLAEAGDLPSAIAMAQQIPADSPLYEQAQARINQWQTRSNAEQGLQQAIARAGAGNPDDLLDAIAIAQQVPNNSSLKTQAKQAIDQWSEQILQAAIGQSAYDAPGAIALASRIPAGTSAFSQAQINISRWKKEIGQR